MKNTVAYKTNLLVTIKPFNKPFQNFMFIIFPNCSNFFVAQILRYGKKSMPHVARLLLVSTFIDDGIRMWLNWGSQQRYIDHEWSCGWHLSTLFVVFNLFAQLISSVLVLSRKHVMAACGVLLAVTIMQVRPLIGLLLLRINSVSILCTVVRS